ncbi:MAG: IclR family transcriptional regulator [Chloroflexi bacterium]|nr:IclR family transcriptional regulator [Chloroflexota bacterium]
MPPKNGNGALVPAVDRAAQILHAIAASEVALGVSELSRQLGLNKSTVHDILATLAHYHFLERDDAAKTYRLGYALAELGQRVSERADVRAVAHPRLVALAHTVEETVFLGAYRDGQVTIVDKEEAPHDFKITSPLGRQLYYSVGAFGKVFLAAMDEADANKLLRVKPLRAFTTKSIVKPTNLRGELRDVRAQGYAFDDEEYLPGVRATAAPVNDAAGRVIAALCVVGFSARMSNDKLTRLAKQTRDTAEQISRAMGAKEYPQWNGVG